MFMLEIKFELKNNRAIAYDNNVEIGECAFVEMGGCWNIVHTEVSTLYQGQGIAKKLVEKVMENANIYNKVLSAECSYAKRVLEKKK